MTKAKEPAATQAACLLAECSASDSEKFATTHQRLSIHDYLPRTFHDGAAEAGKCEWSSHVGASLTPQEAGALAWLLDRFLQPLELAVPAACLLMFVFLVQINHEPEKGSAAVQAYAARAKSQTVRVAELPPADPDAPEHVSGAEVKEFLARLEEFNRSHPQEPGSVNTALPSIELVNDNLWREP